jgi:hypothetical protein
MLEKSASEEIKSRTLDCTVQYSFVGQNLRLFDGVGFFELGSGQCFFVGMGDGLPWTKRFFLGKQKRSMALLSTHVTSSWCRMESKRMRLAWGEGRIG